MDIETCVTLSYLFKTNKKYIFLCRFSTLPSTQTIKVIGIIFFQGFGIGKMVYAQRQTPPPPIHRFRPPPSLYRVNSQ